MRRTPWTITSIEWSSAVSKISGQLLPHATHFVLPDLPSTTPEVRAQFRATLPPLQRIETVAIRQNPSTLLRKAVDVGLNSDNILVVGGNKKPESPIMSTYEAIQECVAVASPTNTSVWAVLDPNCPKSIDDSHRKHQAGATGFITQPILGSRGYERFCAFPHDATTRYVAGVALPKTLKGLRFWKSLLSPHCDLENDALFRDHCKYFERGGDAESWSIQQVEALSGTERVDGVHLMPLQNAGGLMVLLSAMKK